MTPHSRDCVYPAQLNSGVVVRACTMPPAAWTRSITGCVSSAISSQQLAGRKAALEALHGPAAGDPGAFGVGIGELADAAQVFVDSHGAGEVTLGELQAAVDGVDVGILEAGKQQLATGVDHFGTRADQLPYLVMADDRDPLPGDGEAARPGACGVPGVHGALGEDQIGLGHGWCS